METAQVRQLHAIVSDRYDAACQKSVAFIHLHASLCRLLQQKRQTQCESAHCLQLLLPLQHTLQGDRAAADPAEATASDCPSQSQTAETLQQLWQKTCTKTWLRILLAQSRLQKTETRLQMLKCAPASQ